MLVVTAFVVGVAVASSPLSFVMTPARRLPIRWTCELSSMSRVGGVSVRSGAGAMIMCEVVILLNDSIYRRRDVSREEFVFDKVIVLCN